MAGVQAGNQGLEPRCRKNHCKAILSMKFKSDEIELERKDPSTPLYQQVKSLLRRKVIEGPLEPGDQIPTEHELCDAFSISRTPVRQALKELVNEGVLSRQQGSGTFVADPNGQKVSLEALITEKQWAPPLNRALEKYNVRSERNSVSLETEILGRPHFYERIISAIGRGEAPDLALMDSAWVTEFAAYHFIEPFDRLDGDWAQDLKNQLLEPFVERNSYGGQLYAFQPEANVSLLWYREDVFEELGLEPPRTWSQLLEVGDSLKENGWDYPLAFAGGTSAGETTTYQLLPFIWAAGGRVIRDGDVELGKKAVRAVAFLTDLVHEHELASPEVTDYSWDTPVKLFAGGDVAMAIGGSYEKNRLLQYEISEHSDFWGNIGWVPLPGPGKGNQSATAGGMVYVVLRQADHPTVAAEVLQEIMEPESVLVFCEENDRVPTTRGALEALDPDKTHFSHRVASMLDYAHAPPGHVQYAGISEQLQLMFERAILQQASPARSVEKASEVISAFN